MAARFPEDWPFLFSTGAEVLRSYRLRGSVLPAPWPCDALRWGRCSNNGPVFGQLGEDAMERGSVCWVEVQDKVGWWPAQVHEAGL